MLLCAPRLDAHVMLFPPPHPPYTPTLGIHTPTHQVYIHPRTHARANAKTHARNRRERERERERETRSRCARVCSRTCIRSTCWPTSTSRSLTTCSSPLTYTSYTSNMSPRGGGSGQGEEEEESGAEGRMGTVRGDGGRRCEGWEGPALRRCRPQPAPHGTFVCTLFLTSRDPPPCER